MAKEKDSSAECCPDKKKMGAGGVNGGVYGLGFIGALIYFLQNADTFWIGVLGVLKAIVWPAVLIYKVLQFLNI
jgi:hypothetical protein